MEFRSECDNDHEFYIMNILAEHYLEPRGMFAQVQAVLSISEIQVVSSLNLAITAA